MYRCKCGLNASSDNAPPAKDWGCENCGTQQVKVKTCEDFEGATKNAPMPEKIAPVEVSE